MSKTIKEITLVSTLNGHQNPIFTLAQPEHSNLLYSGGNDKGVVEWDLSTMRFNRVLCQVTSSIYTLLSIPDSTLLAIGMRSGQIMIVDRENQSLKANLNTEKGAVFSLQIIPSKRELIAIGEEGVAYVWDLDSFELLYRFKISDTTVRVIAVDPEGKFLAFGDKQGYIYVYSIIDFQFVTKQKIHDLAVTSLLFHAGYLFSGARDAKLTKLSPVNLDVELSITAHMFTVYAIEQSYSEDLIATVSRDKTMKIWRIKDFSLVKNISRDRGFDSHILSINALLWKNQNLYTVSDDKTIKIWKIDAL